MLQSPDVVEAFFINVTNQSPRLLSSCGRFQPTAISSRVGSAYGFRVRLPAVGLRKVPAASVSPSGN